MILTSGVTGKEKKINVVEKSAMDWAGFVDKEGIQDELDAAGKKGLRLTFIDQGPGIPDIDLALTDGYTTGGGMGLGLSGARRLCSEFELDSRVGEGTRITVTQWKRASSRM